MTTESHGPSRRDFLANAGLAAMALAAGGCASARPKIGGAGAMSNFVAPPLARVRVGVVGVGSRGTYALKRLAFMPGVEIAAFCDIDEAAMKRCREFLAQKKLPPAREFLGPVAYRDLCQWDGVDVVYACVPWKLHAPVALAAMRADKHAFVEVPATMDVDSCWELVETSEKTRRHCMMLENCCYGENEMLALNMCRLGVLGETVYGEAGYLHSGKTRGFKLSEFRAEWYMEHRGNYYPTHGLGPVAQYMNINRGDRFDYLVSVDSKQFGFEEVGKGVHGDDPWRSGLKVKMADMNTSIIKTVLGRTIMVQHNVGTAHPYSRLNLIQGTRGVLQDYPLRIAIEETLGKGVHAFDEKKTAEIREKYKHPLWKTRDEIAKRMPVTGHGGMDFLMVLRLSYCLQNGLPLDMNVYDLASWCCLCELTEKSADNRGRSMDIPDFTCGAWKNQKPFGFEAVDFSKLGKNFNVVG